MERGSIKGGGGKVILNHNQNFFCLSRFLISLAPTHFQFAFDATRSEVRMSQIKPNKEVEWWWGGGHGYYNFFYVRKSIIEEAMLI